MMSLIAPFSCFIIAAGYFLEAFGAPAENLQLQGPLSTPRGFGVFHEAHDCFKTLPKDSSPVCQFFIYSNNTKASWNAECVSQKGNETSSVLRVTGEFRQVKIICSASYAVDFVYHGVQPTEAMFVEWSKLIRPNQSLEAQLYSVEVTVHSVQSLFEFHNDPANSYYENPKEDLPHEIKHDYSRSGHFTFPGIFNNTLGTGFYIFFEDTPSQMFLRNKETMRISSPSPSTLLVPCRPSHMNALVNYSLPTGLSRVTPTYLPTEGILLQFPNAESVSHVKGIFTCKLQTAEGKVLETLGFLYPPSSIDANETLFGLNGMDPESNGSGLEITRVADKDCHADQKFIYPMCKTTHPNVVVDTQKLKLITVAAVNFGHMRLVQQFAHPNFVNRSYTAQVSTLWDPLIRELRLTNGLSLRMGTAYCTTGNSTSKLMDFGASLRADKFVPFGYGKDWATFDRKNSSASTHFHISLRNAKEFYIGKEVDILCRINIPVLVKPVVWYTETISEKNITTTTQVYIDYNLEGSNSTYKLKITKNLLSISCASSYWYSDFWRNVSLSIQPQAAVKPEILSPSEYSFSLGSKGRSIKCRALGIPQPEILIMRNGQKVTQNIVEGVDSVILEFPEFTNDDTGEYECVARSVEESRQTVTVYLQSDNNVVLFITIPLVVFALTVLGAVIYVRFFRPEKTGLTKQEIEDFIRGIHTDAERNTEGNNYAHEFAAARPYAKEYEIPKEKFQVDESRVLGSGAFGLVLMGKVEMTPVAVKTVQRNADKQYIKALLSELKIMIYLGHHDNLVPVVGAYTKDLKIGHVFVFVKYIPNGNLQNFLRQNEPHFKANLTHTGQFVGDTSTSEKSFTWYDLLVWSKQIAEGMEYLGSRKVIHGDLAARNILLDEKRIVKITDFGLSRQLYDYNDYIKKQQEPLPWRWMALESLKYMTFSVHSDVWSFGVTLWEIFSLGEIPYPGCAWTLDFVDDLEEGLRMGKPKYAAPEIFALMASCWNGDPVKRPSFSSFKEGLRSFMLQCREASGGDSEDEDGYVHLRQ